MKVKVRFQSIEELNPELGVKSWMGSNRVHSVPGPEPVPGPDLRAQLPIKILGICSQILTNWILN